MPAAGFIPGPGDTMASSPLAQMGSLMAILRENQESKARVAQYAATTQEAMQRSQVAQQRAALLGLQVTQFPQAQADAHQALMSEVGLRGAQQGSFEQQTALSKALQPGDVLQQDTARQMTLSQTSEFKAQARHSNALADQENYHTQQLKEADSELHKNSNWLMEAYGFEGPAKSFNLNFVTAPILDNLAKTQYESRFYQQRGDMMKAMGDKAEAQAGYFESKVKDAPEYRIMTELSKYPERAPTYIDDSNPVVAKFAKSVVDHPGVIKPKDQNVNQVVAGLMTRAMHDPSLDADGKIKAITAAGALIGLHPRMIQDPYDMQTGVQPPPRPDIDGLYQQLAPLASVLDSATSTPTPTTAAPAAAQPSRVRMTDPQGRSVTVRADQIDEAKAQGYKER